MNEKFRTLIHCDVGASEMPLSIELVRDGNGKVIDAVGYNIDIYTPIMKKLRLNATYHEMPILDDWGGCDENSTCWGQMELLRHQDPQQDLQIVQEPFSFVSFVDKPPLLMGKTFQEFEAHILSYPFESSENNRIGYDVIESLECIGWDVVGTYLLWFFVAWSLTTLFSHFLKRVVDIESPRYQLVWEMFGAVFDQADFTATISSHRVISLTLLLSLFLLMQFYDSYFITDLSHIPQDITIDTLEQLADSGLLPMFFKGERNLETNFFNSTNPVYRKIWKRYESSDSSITHPQFKTSGGSVHARFLRNHTHALLAIYPALLLLVLLDCQFWFDKNEFDGHPEKYIPPLFIGSEIHARELRGMVLHTNISWELRHRIDYGVQQQFEFHLLEIQGGKGAVQSLLKSKYLKGVMPDADSFKKCCNRIKNEIDAPAVMGLSVDMMGKFFMKCAIGLQIAFYVLIIEFAFFKGQKPHHKKRRVNPNLLFVRRPSSRLSKILLKMNKKV